MYSTELAKYKPGMQVRYYKNISTAISTGKIVKINKESVSIQDEDDDKIRLIHPTQIMKIIN